jgi:hypothetical protein
MSRLLPDDRPRSIATARYLYTQQAKTWDLPDNGDDYGSIVIAAACHFCPVNP